MLAANRGARKTHLSSEEFHARDRRFRVIRRKEAKDTFVLVSVGTKTVNNPHHAIPLSLSCFVENQEASIRYLTVLESYTHTIPSSKRGKS